MINKYPGTCCNCLHDVKANEGLAVKDRLGWQVKHVACPDKPAPKAPEGFWMPNTLEAFTAQVNVMNEPSKLNHVRDVLNRLRDRGDKHPLRHETYGFASCYKRLQERIDALGFPQKNDRTCFRPLNMAATKPL